MSAEHYVERTCEGCDKKFQVRQSVARRRPCRFCSHGCQGKATRGALSPSWVNRGSVPLPRGPQAAYLAGVLNGDGYLTRGDRQLALRVKDEDFAVAFAAAIFDAFGVQAARNLSSRGYWETRVTRSSMAEAFGSLRSAEPETDEDSAAWLRGLFDSEGNACLSRSNQSPGAWNRRVAIYSTEPDTLKRAAGYLTRLGVDTILYQTKAHLSSGHLGTRVVFELRVRPGRDNFARFASVVGSSIARKREVLDAIPGTYQDRSDYCRRGGAAGCATRWGTAQRDAR